MSLTTHLQSPADALRFPILCGADLELGNFATGLDLPEGTAYYASRALLREFDGVSTGSNLAPSVSVATGDGASASSTSAHEVSDQRQAGYHSQDWGRKFLFNGGCAYVDLNHLEVCLPEVLSAYDHVAYTHTMYQLAQRAAEAANARQPAGRKIHVLANNSDGQGNSYGSHLNFLVSRPTWEEMVYRRWHMLGFLAAYQVSSILFTGLGKAGSENRAPAARYQLSQRADFMEILCGPQTTHRRPIVNSRDEALCGSLRAASGDPMAAAKARLHVIFYDHNLCHGASLLKVGVMQLILAMIEAGWIDTGLLLDDPVLAVTQWSHDPLLRATARLISGAEITAIDLQLRFFELAGKFVAGGHAEGIVPHAQDILRLWGDTLDKLKAGQFGALAGRLDWVLKLTILQQALKQRPDLAWDSPSIKHLDHLYSSLDPAEGLYWAYERRGLVERHVQESRIARCAHEPPSNTRAWTRAALLLKADPAEVEDVDWDYIRFALSDDTTRTAPRYFTLHLSNPLRWTRAETEQHLPESGNLLAALTALGARETTAQDPYALTCSSYETHRREPLTERTDVPATTDDHETARKNK